MDFSRPLAGLTVVDLTWVLAGPLGTRILGNFGARVIKVESRVHPDSIRFEMRPPESNSENTSGLFAQANPGKLSVAIDLSKEAGRDLVRRLIGRADVVTNNYRPGVMERLGLGYERLCELNPGVILVNMPGCGNRGPWARIPTMGNLIMGASGMNWLGGFPGSPPRGLGTAYPDFIAPYLLVTVILAALRQRHRTGLGREINLSQLSATISLLGVEWLQYSDSRKASARRANRDPNWCPHGVYPTSGEDEWIAIAVRGDDGFATLCDLMGHPNLADEPSFATLEARKANEDALDALLAGWTRGRDRWELAALLQRQGIAAAPVEGLADVTERDPQLRGHFQLLEPPVSDPDVAIIIDGEPIRFAGVERPLRRPPMLGEHSEEILRELAGVTEDEFDRLVMEGVIN